MNDADAIKEMELFRRLFRDGLLYIFDEDKDVMVISSTPFHSGADILRSTLSTIEVDYDKESDRKKQAESARAYLRHIEAGRRNGYIGDSESQVPQLRACMDQRDQYKNERDANWNDNVRLVAKLKQLSEELALFDTGKKGGKKSD